MCMLTVPYIQPKDLGLLDPSHGAPRSCGLLIDKDYFSLDGMRRVSSDELEGTVHIDDKDYTIAQLLQALNYGHQPLFSDMVTHRHSCKSILQNAAHFCDRALLENLMSSFPASKVITLEFPKGDTEVHYFKNRNIEEERLFREKIVSSFEWYFINSGPWSGRPISYFVSDVVKFVKFLTENVKRDLPAGKGRSIPEFILDRNEFWRTMFCKHSLCFSFLF